jgi:hypothetical protein
MNHSRHTPGVWYGNTVHYKYTLVPTSFVRPSNVTSDDSALYQTNLAQTGLNEYSGNNVRKSKRSYCLMRAGRDRGHARTQTYTNLSENM